MSIVKQRWCSRSAMLVGLEAVERSGPGGSQRVVSKANRPGASRVRQSGQGGAAGGALAWQIDGRTSGAARRRRLTLRRKSSDAKAARDARARAAQGRHGQEGGHRSRKYAAISLEEVRHRALRGCPARGAKAGRCRGLRSMPGGMGGGQALQGVCRRRATAAAVGVW